VKRRQRKCGAGDNSAASKIRKKRRKPMTSAKINETENNGENQRISENQASWHRHQPAERKHDVKLGVAWRRQAMKINYRRQQIGGKNRQNIGIENIALAAVALRACCPFCARTALRAAAPHRIIAHTHIMLAHLPAPRCLYVRITRIARTWRAPSRHQTRGIARQHRQQRKRRWRGGMAARAACLAARVATALRSSLTPYL